MDWELVKGAEGPSKEWVDWLDQMRAEVHKVMEMPGWAVISKILSVEGNLASLDLIEGDDFKKVLRAQGAHRVVTQVLGEVERFVHHESDLTRYYDENA